MQSDSNPHDTLSSLKGFEIDFISNNLQSLDTTKGMFNDDSKAAQCLIELFLHRGAFPIFRFFEG